MIKQPNKQPWIIKYCSSIHSLDMIAYRDGQEQFNLFLINPPHTFPLLVIATTATQQKIVPDK